MALDPVDYAVVSQSLIAAAREMGAKLVRSAYSTIVREANDASTAILDHTGNVVAQSELIPVQLGSLSATFAPCAELNPPEDLVEGDFYINNDPYHGGQHLPDIFIFTPIFYDNEVVAFSATVAHHIDVGGGAPGLNMSARELYQEGLIIPPGRYNFDRDWNGGPLERLLAANIRVPDQTIGDFYAQFAGNSVGAARVQGLCRKYGTETVRATMAALLDYSEKRVRLAIARTPDGIYHGEAKMDDDGINDRPLAIRVAVTIDGDGMSIDFAGSNPQVDSNMNCPFASTLAAAYSCIKAVLAPPDLPFNQGSVRPVAVTAPYGSVLNPKPPAPVRARMTATYRVFNAVMDALAKAVPEQVIACGFDTTTGPYLSRRSEKGYRVYHEIVGGGYGASSHQDGCSGVAGPMSNCANTPVEVLDMEFDYFRVREYGLIDDSGGPGRFRGGLGIRRRFEIVKDGVTFAQYGDRFRIPPPGVFGGDPGQRASCTIRREDVVLPVKSKDSAELLKGDELTLYTAGGGGYGSPAERPRERIRADIEEGLVLRERALEAYGADKFE
jgi:N-methylhydantoinase B